VTIRGVLIDFSGTLFHLEINHTWLANHDDEEKAQQLMQALTAPVLPGTHLPAHLADNWHKRDLDPEIHRTVYTETMRQAGLTEPGSAERGYELLVDPANWPVYPDVQEALERLRANAIPVAVVSNIAWDVRTSFDRFGITHLVDEFVLSYLEGTVKPEEKIFRIACERLGVEPADALMIGDSAEADGGAAALGIAVELVEPLNTADRPDALLTALAKHGL
jgi:HAD superfamily hydrolase (TIGR01509 family)